MRLVWAACGQLAVSAREFGLCPALVERTEGCKQLVESMPGTVPCARLLTDAPLKSHNTPAKELLLLVTPTPAPGSWRLRGIESLTELYLNAGLNCFCPGHLAKNDGKTG